MVETLYQNMLVGDLLESPHLGRSPSSLDKRCNYKHKLGYLSARETGTMYLSAKVVKRLGCHAQIKLKYKRDKILNLTVRH